MWLFMAAFAENERLAQFLYHSLREFLYKFYLKEIFLFSRESKFYPKWTWRMLLTSPSVDRKSCFNESFIVLNCNLLLRWASLAFFASLLNWKFEKLYHSNYDVWDWYPLSWTHVLHILCWANLASSDSVNATPCQQAEEAAIRDSWWVLITALAYRSGGHEIFMVLSRIVALKRETAEYGMSITFAYALWIGEDVS